MCGKRDSSFSNPCLGICWCRELLLFFSYFLRKGRPKIQQGLQKKPVTDLKYSPRLMFPVLGGVFSQLDQRVHQLTEAGGKRRNIKIIFLWQSNWWEGSVQTDLLPPKWSQFNQNYKNEFSKQNTFVTAAHTGLNAVKKKHFKPLKAYLNQKNEMLSSASSLLQSVFWYRVQEWISSSLACLQTNKFAVKKHQPAFFLSPGGKGSKEVSQKERDPSSIDLRPLQTFS